MHQPSAILDVHKLICCFFVYKIYWWGRYDWGKPSTWCLIL